MIKNFMPTPAAIVGLAFVVLSAPCLAQNNGKLEIIYVSPANGNDAWSGLSKYSTTDGNDGPLKTLNIAQLQAGEDQSEGVTLPIKVVVEQLEAPVQTGEEYTAPPPPAPRPATPTPAPPTRLRVVDSSVPEVGSAVSSPPARYVFAHYIVAYPDYDTGVDGYEKEIIQAQAAGIDGFALNCGAWNAYYQTNAANIFKAATQLNSGFKLFFSADMSNGLSTANIVDMIQTYGNTSNYFNFDGKPVLSTWGGESNHGNQYIQDHWNDIKSAIKQATGKSVFLVPYFYVQNPPGTGVDVEIPSAGEIEASFDQTWEPVIDGYFYPSTAGVPAQLIPAGEAFASVLHGSGKLYMAGISVQYWGEAQKFNGRRYNEFEGGAGMESQWKAIIDEKADWVEMFTWNDFRECTYWSPIDDPGLYMPHLPHGQGFFLTHSGALALGSYYIQWYKTGVQPPPPGGVDNVYCFYRTQPKDMVANNDIRGPVTSQGGNVQDDIYITTILPRPAQIVVNSGGTTRTFYARAGLVNSELPFSVGPQTVSLIRDGQPLVKLTGAPIVASAAEYDYDYYTMSGHD